MTRNARFSAPLLVLFLSVPARAAPAATEPIPVVVGHHEVIELPGVTKVEVDDPKVAKVRTTTSSEIVITGLTKGRAALTAWTRSKEKKSFFVIVDDSLPGARDVTNSVSLTVGHQSVLAMPGLQRIAVGDPKVADVQPLAGKEILLSGLAEGRTSLIVWRANQEPVTYLLEVQTKRLEDTVGEVKRLLSSIHGMKAHIVGERAFLDCHDVPEDDLDPDAIERIKHVCGLYGAQLDCKLDCLPL